jgi:SAM-dependent methyltransferase
VQASVFSFFASSSIFCMLSIHKVLTPPRSFVFRGETYDYFYHPYNFTWGNERAVEIPIAWKFFSRSGQRSTLEVGNVLSHYFSHIHDVVDKYEKATGVLNVDIVDFHPTKKYDLIVSISTMEHVGWDEAPRDPEKIWCGFEVLYRLLAPGGALIVTLPIGHHTEFDRRVDDDASLFTQKYYLKRVSMNNRWEEVEYENVKDARYNKAFSTATAVFIGIIEKADGP